MFSNQFCHDPANNGENQNRSAQRKGQSQRKTMCIIFWYCYRIKNKKQEIAQKESSFVFNLKQL